MKLTSFALVIFASAAAFGGDSALKKAVVPAEEDHWKFQLSMPGWLANIKGEVGYRALVTF